MPWKLSAIRNTWKKEIAGPSEIEDGEIKNLALFRNEQEAKSKKSNNKISDPVYYVQ
jgi:hypothetical protein